MVNLFLAAARFLCDTRIGRTRIKTMLERVETREPDALELLGSYIRDGGYSAGDRLPPERQLIEELGVSRSTLRRALDAMERSGAIWRHVGKGTFVAEGDPGSADQLAGLARQLTPMRMMQARMCLEPALAREAAVHASGEAMTAMRLAMTRAHAASTWAEYEAQDDQFHRSVAEAGDNLLLLSVFDQLNRVRRAVAFGTVERRSAKPPADHSSFAEHEAIAAAIVAREPDAAWSAMRAHLRSVSARLFP